MGSKVVGFKDSGPVAGPKPKSQGIIIGWMVSKVGSVVGSKRKASHAPTSYKDSGPVVGPKLTNTDKG